MYYLTVGTLPACHQCMADLNLLLRLMEEWYVCVCINYTIQLYTPKTLTSSGCGTDMSDLDSAVIYSYIILVYYFL